MPIIGPVSPAAKFPPIGPGGSPCVPASNFYYLFLGQEAHVQPNPLPGIYNWSKNGIGWQPNVYVPTITIIQGPPGAGSLDMDWKAAYLPENVFDGTFVDIFCLYDVSPYTFDPYELQLDYDTTHSVDAISHGTSFLFSQYYPVAYPGGAFSSAANLFQPPLGGTTTRFQIQEPAGGAAVVGPVINNPIDTHYQFIADSSINTLNYNTPSTGPGAVGGIAGHDNQSVLNIRLSAVSNDAVDPAVQYDFNILIANIELQTLDSRTFISDKYQFVSNGTCPAHIVSYLWDFGDGTTDTTANPIHTFATAGVHTVTLTITYDDGSVVSSSQTF